MATSKTAICNLALQKLGAKRISDYDEDSVNARACRTVYESVRDSELRANVWNFAIGRAQLAEEATAPSWGKNHQYQLPSDFLRLAPDDEHCNYFDKDWVIEGKFILTDDVSPIRIRYVKRIDDVTLFDPLFERALACKIANETCEQITQSNTKKESILSDYRMAIADAKKVNGIEKRAQVAPDSEWINRRG